MDKVALSDLAATKRGAPFNEQILAAWNGICRFMVTTLNQGKGVELPGFGVFAYQIDKLGLGNSGSLNTRIPLFFLNKAFQDSNGITINNNLQLTPNVLYVPVNFAAVAAYADLSRDSASNSYHHFMVALSETIRRKESINLDFGIGHLVIAGGANEGEFRFKDRPRFIGQETVPHDQSVPKFQTTRKVDHPYTEYRKEYFAKHGDSSYEEVPLSQVQLQTQRPLRPALSYHIDTNRLGMARTLEKPILRTLNQPLATEHKGLLSYTTIRGQETQPLHYAFPANRIRSADDNALKRSLPPILSSFGKVPRVSSRTLHPFDQNSKIILTPADINDMKYLPPHGEQAFAQHHPDSANATWASRTFDASVNYTTASPDNFQNRYPAPSSLASTVRYTQPQSTSDPDHPDKFNRSISLRQNLAHKGTLSSRLPEAEPPQCRSFSSTALQRDLNNSTALQPGEDHLLVSGRRLGDTGTGRVAGRIDYGKVDQRDHRKFMTFRARAAAGDDGTGKDLSADTSAAPAEEDNNANQYIPTESPAAVKRSGLGDTDWTSTITLTDRSYAETLHGFPSIVTYEPVEGLRPNICRMCKRHSDFLPQPNMCSMCIARARLIRERDIANAHEKEKNERAQRYHEQLDKEAFEQDKIDAAKAREARGKADEKNVELIQTRTMQKMETSRDPDINEALSTGFVRCTDVFDGRPDEATDEERKTRLRDALITQRGLDKDRKNRFVAEEKAYAEAARTREQKEVEEHAEYERETKEGKKDWQRAWLEHQLATRNPGIPGTHGYDPVGDPFTLKEDEAAEVIKARNQAYLNDLKHERHAVKEKKKREEEEEIERGKIANQMEREYLEKSTEEEIARTYGMKEKQAAAYDETIARKREFIANRLELGEEKGAYRYGPDGDPFTQQDEEAMRRTKFEKDSKNAVGLQKQIVERKVKAEEEKIARAKDTAEIIKGDADDLAWDRAQDAKHRAFNEMYGKEQAEQTQRDMTRKTTERSMEKDTDWRYTSPDIGEVQPPFDCERPYYRKRLLTKKDRMMAGF